MKLIGAGHASLLTSVLGSEAIGVWVCRRLGQVRQPVRQPVNYAKQVHFNCKRVSRQIVGCVLELSDYGIFMCCQVHARNSRAVDLQAVKKEVDAAVEQAKKGTIPPLDVLYKNIYKAPPLDAVARGIDAKSLHKML